MKKQAIVTPDTIKEINRLYKNNISVKYIARKLGLRTQTVRNHIN